jgi:SAM-dependent methyltransferase
VSLDLADLYDAYDTDGQSVVEFLEWIVARYGIRVPPRILDVGCGPGRLLGPLASLGWEVVGLEPDPSYRARATRIAESLGATVIAGGFADIEGEEAFDLILGMNGSFAHLLTPDERAEGLARCRRALRKGGALILDLPNLLRILHEYQVPKDRQVSSSDARITLSRHHSVDYEAATFTTHETYAVEESNGRRWIAAKDHVYSIMALPDLRYLLERQGLGKIELFHSISDREGGRIGERMLMIARVP